MAGKDKPRIIAVEEHFWDHALAETYPDATRLSGGDIQQRLFDFTELRLKAMDDAGIDVQVIGHGSPSTQKLGPDVAVELSRGVNDRLAKAITIDPNRLKAYAVLPTAVPEAAADELQRAVEELGFVGAMVNGLAYDGSFFDERRYWPIFARAEKLEVPVYLHPSMPHPDVMRAYYQDYVQDYQMVIRAAWGFTVETATQAIRLVLSGVFDSHPGLKLILGHLGETIPFLLWRINQALSRPGQKQVSFRETFSRHFWVSTSGFFSNPALVCTMTELGADRILFAVDYPFVPNNPGTDWANELQVSVEDKEKILSGNAIKLLKL